MPLQYITNPELKIEDVAALRNAVGWETRAEKLKKIIGFTYMTVACFDGDHLIGFVDVISDGVDDALVRNLIVHPSYQRRGIALVLLKRVIEKIKADQVKTINVLFEPELIELYHKAGFSIIQGGIIDNEAEEF